MKHILRWFSPDRALWVGIVLFVVYFTVVPFARHDNFYSRRLDLGNMDQTVWNVLHGNGFTLTDPMGTNQESRLAVHADILLILLAPFYLIWSSPKMLILIQTIVLGLGALPVYWIASDKLKSKKIGFLFAAAYLLYPPLQRLLLHDFHAVALSSTFLLFAYWFMYKEAYRLFVLSAILAGLGKEDIWLVIGLMGLYIAGVKKRYWIGAATALVSFGAFYLLFWHLIPNITTAGQHFALTYLSEYGESQGGIIKNILTHPLTVFRTVILPDRLWYYFQLLLPVGLLSVFAPTALMFAVPVILINILSSSGHMRMIDYQYTSGITPFVFMSAIEGYQVCLKLLKKKRPFLALWLGVAAVIFSYQWGEMPIGRNSRFRFFTTAQPEKQLMGEIEETIDHKYSVSVTNNIGSHFSQRQFLYNYPVNAQNADYTVIYLGDPYAWPSGDEQKRVLGSLLEDDGYQLIAQQGNFYAFKKKGI